MGPYIRMKFNKLEMEEWRKKLATHAICAGHLASYINIWVLEKATTFAERG